ncbi:MAG: Fur family transcriptional regulator [Rhodovibrionaceae bacterium]
MAKHQPRPFQPQDHNHGRCVQDALAAAQALCADQGLRLTPLRRRVLELIWESHKPQGAYDLLERLDGEETPGAKAPPTIYRTLEWLQAQGFVHRIESLNAFIGCPVPDHGGAEPHASQFFICEACGTAAELHDDGVAAAIHRQAKSLGFSVADQTVEIKGRCPSCREAAR